MIESSLIGTYEFAAGTNSTFSKLVGGFASWGIIRLSPSLIRFESGMRHKEEVGVPATGSTHTAHSCWTGLGVVPKLLPVLLLRTNWLGLGGWMLNSASL